jgi:site-specific DNA-methyltransferase (adenine-specific)
MTVLPNLDDKSFQVVCIDPPYNIGKDVWDNIDDYINFIVGGVETAERKLKDNGSFFIFHNDMETIADLMVAIRKRTNLVFRQMITWNKRFEASSKKGFLDGFIVKNDLYNWNKMCEYVLFYTFDNSYKLREARQARKVSQLTISKEIPSKTGGLTGWYSNIETGRNLPTRDTIVPIEKHLGLSYDDIVPKYRNQKTHHSVWNYDMAPRCEVHVTPKPVDLLKNILLHTTDEGDTVLDYFGGSGSMAKAAHELGRKCVLVEKEKKYCDYIKKSFSA